MTRTCAVFLMCASLSSSALAQTAPRLDPPAARQRVAAVASGRHRLSRVDRLLRDTLIGAGAGAATGWLLWGAARDRATAGPGPARAIASTALFGAATGAWVGVVQGWGAGRHPDARPTRHTAAAPLASPDR